MDEPDLVVAVGSIAAVFGRHNVRHALIGGLAVGLRSRPRSTKDADFIVHVSALTLPSVLEDLVARGFNIDVVETIRRWSADRLVVFHRGQVRIDWMQPVVPLFAHVLDTAESKSWLDTQVRVATAEGLVLTKLVAFREQDQADIVALLEANRDTFDIDLTRREWQPYAASEVDRTAWLETAIARIVPKRGSA